MAEFVIYKIGNVPTHLDSSGGDKQKTLVIKGGDKIL